VREAPHVVGLQADASQELGHALLEGSPAADAVHDQRFAHDLADGHPRVEGRLGVLEHHLHGPADVAKLALGQREQVDLAAVEMERHRALSGLDEPDQAPAEGGLSAAALADEAHGLTPVHRQADVVDGAHAAPRPAHDPAAYREVPAHAGRLDQNLWRNGRQRALLLMQPAGHLMARLRFAQRRPHAADLHLLGAPRGEGAPHRDG